MTITERWTIVTDFVTRMVERGIHTICLLLVGALIGAWIVHLTEASRVQEQRGYVVEIGKRLNLCLVNREEAGRPHCRAWQTTEPMPGKSRRRLG